MMVESVKGMTIEQKYVLIFDFCSSTSILEDLTLSESQERWCKLLLDIEIFLIEQSNTNNFEIYKFIGDGWILLFNTDFPLIELFLLSRRLCEKYNAVFEKRIKRVLSTQIANIGITFGLDTGSLIHFVIDGKDEYIGRPINLAARLQGSIKDKDSKPQGKILMSKKVYNSESRIISQKYKTYSVTRTLRNIYGGKKHELIKLTIYEKP